VPSSLSRPESALGWFPGGQASGLTRLKAPSEAKRRTRGARSIRRVVPAVVPGATPKLLLATMTPLARRFAMRPHIRVPVLVDRRLNIGVAELLLTK
jgi:hypothetical protein